MDKSVFTEKRKLPQEGEVEVALGETYVFWKEVVNYVHSLDGKLVDEWNFPGEKYGWSFRIKDKKRAIIYLLPRDRFFKVAFVFGHKAFDYIMQSEIAENIKIGLETAKPYAEGRGIRIDVRGLEDLQDIKKLVDIKLSF